MNALEKVNPKTFSQCEALQCGVHHPVARWFRFLISFSILKFRLRYDLQILLIQLNMWLRLDYCNWRNGLIVLLPRIRTQGFGLNAVLKQELLYKKSVLYNRFEVDDKHRLCLILVNYPDFEKSTADTMCRISAADALAFLLSIGKWPKTVTFVMSRIWSLNLSVNRWIY